MINSPSDIKETATSNVANLTLRHDGIITHELMEGKFKEDIETLTQELDIFLEWSKDEKKKFLIDTRDFKEFEMSERLFIQENINKFCNRYAILVDKGISVYFYNILNYLTKPPVTTRCFYRLDKAISWLNEK